MRVHVVSRDYNQDNLLGRLVQQLVSHAAFSVAEEPDDRADLNYFFPYLERCRYPLFNATPTAAWFTHRDDGRAKKEVMWRDAAQSVDLRLTCASQYAALLSAHGPTQVVMPPLDRDKFRPGAHTPQADNPLVGTSGFVYPGGRKGEALVKRLADGEAGCRYAASGSGWPVPTRTYRWGEMHEFYQGLDVYVCTSTIEGIGYGPLEAMACGVPVVIPAGVGIFDDLPALENVHRYQAGDFNDLRRALREAVSTLEAGGYNRQSLRGATARFTRQAWQDSTLSAIENHLYGVPPVGVLPSWQDQAGVYYVAYGDPARACARRAIRSWKQHMPTVPVALVSDHPLGAGEDVFIPLEDGDIGGRKAKLRIDELAPAAWQYVLYLDADTEIVADVSFLFEVLADGWEMLICTNPAKYKLCTEMKRPDNHAEVEETWAVMGSDEMLQLNGGVFGLRRNERTREFMRRWYHEWDRYAGRDQPPLHRALYTSPLRVYVLGNEWNTVTRYLDAERTAGILHYPMQARRWRGRIDGRLDSEQAWAAVARFDGRAE